MVFDIRTEWHVIFNGETATIKLMPFYYEDGIAHGLLWYTSKTMDCQFLDDDFTSAELMTIEATLAMFGAKIVSCYVNE